MNGPELPGPQELGRILILAGLAIAAVGGLLLLAGKLPLGRLPGDFRLEGENYRFYFPLMTSLIVSLVLSLLLWFLRR